MARKTLRDQLRESAKSATASGAEHRAIVEAIEGYAKKHEAQNGQDGLDSRNDPSDQKLLPFSQNRSSSPAESPPLPLEAPEPESAGRTTRRDKTNEQANRAEQSPLVDKVRWPGHLTRPLDLVNPFDKVRWPGHLALSGDQATRPPHLTESPDQVKRPCQVTWSGDKAALLPSKIPTKEVANSPGQKAILRYLQANGDHVTTQTVISRETGVPIKTVQRSLEKFVAHGILEKRPWRIGRQNGLRVCLTWPSDSATGLGHLTRSFDKAICPRQMTESPPPLKIDREDLNLSISLEIIELTWPNLARAGFSSDQMDQVLANLIALNKPIDRVVAGLDHAEWELERGQMLDKAGQPVTDPCSWVFTALARTGYYRRPKGYVSPEEQAAKDAEAEAKAVVAARQVAEQAQFEAWRDGLSPDALADALRGHPGGPKDAWLKKIWRDRRN